MHRAMEIKIATEVLSVTRQSKLFSYYKAQSDQTGGFTWVFTAKGKVRHRGTGLPSPEGCRQEWARPKPPLDGWIEF